MMNRFTFSVAVVLLTACINRKDNDDSEDTSVPDNQADTGAIDDTSVESDTGAIDDTSVESDTGAIDDTSVESDTSEDSDTDDTGSLIDADGDGVAMDEDCDDANANVAVSCTDVDGDGVYLEDGDCDDANANVAGSCTDADGDGFYAEGSDCDDSDITIHPGAVEFCDSIDNDCDPGTVEDGKVSQEDSQGVWTDITSTLNNFSTTEDATHHFCEGTHSVSYDVNHELTVIGHGNKTNIVLSGGGAQTLFSVNSIVDLSIESVTLSDAFATTTVGSSPLTRGGAVFCSPELDDPEPGDLKASVSLSDVHVLSSEADLGGGIYSNFCDLNIVDSLFAENSNPDLTLSSAAGSALMSRSGNLNSENSVYENNSSVRGAVYMRLGELDMEGDVLESNVGQQGSAIQFNNTNASDVVLIDVSLFDNSSSGYGAIHIGELTSLAAANMTFSGNTDVDISSADSMYYISEPLFSCDNGYCGNQDILDTGNLASVTIAYANDWGLVFNSAPIYLSNILEISGTPTLEDFCLQTDQLTVNDCDIDFHVYQWDHALNHWSGTPVFQEEKNFHYPTSFQGMSTRCLSSSYLGLAFEDGDKIALGVGFPDNNGDGVADCALDIELHEPFFNNNVIYSPFEWATSESMGPGLTPGNCQDYFYTSSMVQDCGLTTYGTSYLLLPSMKVTFREE